MLLLTSKLPTHASRHRLRRHQPGNSHARSPHARPRLGPQPNPCSAKTKRFEVDGANLAVKFVQDSIQAGHTTSATWDKHRQEELWSAIALHTSGSLAIPHINPTMALIHLSIAGDFFGPDLPPPLPAGLITEDEYKAIVRAYPREGFCGGVGGYYVWLV